MKQPIQSPEQAVLNNPSAIALFHMAMLERGIYLARRGMAVLSVVQVDEDFDAFKEAFADVLKKFDMLFNEAAQDWIQLC